MSDGKLGLAETVSMAVGGMVGGGIFAVLAVELLYFERAAMEREVEEAL